MSEIQSQIEKLSQEFEGSNYTHSQEFLLFREAEKDVVTKLEKRLKLPKTRVLAIASKLLLEQLEGEKKENGEESENL